MTVLGWGSNVLPSDQGVPGLVVVNRALEIRVEDSGFVEVDTGCALQDLFLKTAQSSLGGFEFAVGIPGTVGGALVSNAGAYRSNVSARITEIELVYEGARKWVDASFLKFSYRDSILRRQDPPACVLLKVRFQLSHEPMKSIFDAARDHQRQRISKQPAPASAGSFFKNVNDVDLANRLPHLPLPLRDAGVVPAGYLIEQAGLRGMRHGGAMVGRKHANFLLNVANATATEIRQLAGLVKRRVLEQYGVALEEEVLYLGDWTSYNEVWND